MGEQEREINLEEKKQGQDNSGFDTKMVINATKLLRKTLPWNINEYEIVRKDKWE